MPSIQNLKYILLGLLAVSLGYSMFKSTGDIIRNSDRLGRVSNEVTRLEAEKAVLEAEIIYKQSSEYIAEAARNQLNMVLPGEEVYVVRDTGGPAVKEGLLGKSGQSVLSSNTLKINGNRPENWYLWFRLFFN